MKLRLLNAGHSVLGILGSVYGYENIHECVSDELFATFLRKFMEREATPVLDAVEGIDLDAYKDILIERFGNRTPRTSCPESVWKVLPNCRRS
jgi:mannitol 2-dehydrogenase